MLKFKDKFNNKKSKLVLFDDSVHIDLYYLYKDEYEATIRNFLKNI
ncbi:hypothetical protein [Clostridium tetanomorphum]|nr:hypothetical protein [Clostridium tetanomorphum]